MPRNYEVCWFLLMSETIIENVQLTCNKNGYKFSIWTRIIRFLEDETNVSRPQTVEHQVHYYGLNGSSCKRASLG